jgi:hypothetical protein
MSEETEKPSREQIILALMIKNKLQVNPDLDLNYAIYEIALELLKDGEK